MKKIFFTMALAVLLAVSLNKLVHAVGALNNLPVPAFNDYGNRQIPFSTQCVSGSWTPIISSSTISRLTIYEIPTDFSATTVCISTYMAGDGTTCSDSTNGIELSTGTSGISIFYDYSRVGYQCRTRGGNGQIKGIRYFDSGDWNNVQ